MEILLIVGDFGLLLFSREKLGILWKELISMKEAINKKLNDMKDENLAIIRNLEDNNLKWCFRTPDNPSWKRACALIDQLYANSMIIQLLEKQEETD